MSLAALLSARRAAHPAPLSRCPRSLPRGAEVDGNQSTNELNGKRQERTLQAQSSQLDLPINVGFLPPQTPPQFGSLAPSVGGWPGLRVPSASSAHHPGLVA